MNLRNRILMFGLVAGLAFGLTAQANEPINQAAASEPEAKSDTQAERIERFCPDATASRIKRSHGRCIAAGRVYTREELFRTGETNTGAALSKLDPSLRGG